jgi:MFS family permease
VPRVPLFVVAIALANFLVPLNSTMIVVALPTIARDLRVDQQAVSWLITLYLIAMAALMPIGGRIGDRYGPRRVLLLALAGFTVASGLAPLARDLPALVVFRVLQAAFAAAVAPNAMGLLRGGATSGRAGAYFGVSGAMTGIGASAGPILGGIFASIDWRWIFAANVPLVLAIIALAWSTLPRVPGRRTASPDVTGALSLGAILSVAAWTLLQSDENAVPLTVALTLAVLLAGTLFVRYESRHADAALPPALFRSRGFSGANACIALSLGAILSVAAWTLLQSDENAVPLTVALTLAVLLAGTLFVRYESRHADAALPPALFRSRGFSGANACIALSNVALYGTMLAIPFALGAGLEVWSGLAIAAMSVGNIVVAPIGGTLVDRVGAHVPVVIGGLLIAAGITLPVALTFYPTLLLIAMPIAGAGIALTFPATRVAALDAAPERFAGLAAGVTSTSRYFGGIVGALITGVAVGRGDLAAIPAAFVIFATAGLASAVVGATTLDPVRGRVDARGDEAGAAD